MDFRTKKRTSVTSCSGALKYLACDIARYTVIKKITRFVTTYKCFDFEETNPEEGTKHSIITLYMYQELEWFNRGERVQNTETAERCAG